MQCPECLRSGGPRLRGIQHGPACSFWTADRQEPIYVETLVTAWDLDVRAFFTALVRASTAYPWTAKEVLEVAIKRADEVEKLRRERRGE